MAGYELIQVHRWPGPLTVLCHLTELGEVNCSVLNVELAATVDGELYVENPTRHGQLNSVLHPIRYT